MLQFWLAVIALMLLGYALLIPAFFVKPRERGQRDRLNLLLHRQRQDELSKEAGSEDEFDRLKAESERNLLADLDGTPRTTAEPVAGGKLALSLALLVLPAFGLITYLTLGQPDLIGNERPLSAGTGQDAQRLANIQDSVRRLADKLREHPDDVQGWVLLGRSLSAIGEAEKAMTAFETARKLAPDNLDVKAVYAEALVEADRAGQDERPAKILAEILAQQPEHPGGLWVAGVMAAQRGDGAKAASYWERLRKQFPPESEQARELQAFIAKVQGKPTADAPSAPAAEPANAGKQIRVKVALAAPLKEKAAPDDTLFIFARAADGPPMPLAVARKKVSDLPIEVSLDDSMAMVQGMNLSSFERLIIGARISKSGRPTPSPGDLQGSTEPIKVENNSAYSVTIDKEVGADQR